MKALLKSALIGAGLVALATTAQAGVGACLITKNNTNPFFVKMKEGAEAGAKDAGIDLQAFAGEKDGDASPQITAIENCVAAGVKGILITPSNDSVGPALKEARAKGILVISLDTPLGDADAQDMTFATDNFEAGTLIGSWAKAQLGDKAASAKIAMLDINKDNISVDVLRDTGFLKGFGIEVPDGKVMGSEKDPRVIGHESSQANPEGGQKAMETLLAKDPDKRYQTAAEVVLDLLDPLHEVEERGDFPPTLKLRGIASRVRETLTPDDPWANLGDEAQENTDPSAALPTRESTAVNGRTPPRRTANNSGLLMTVMLFFLAMTVLAICGIALKYIISKAA